ncbi:MAG: helix-turn-helix domain-containing protein [Planctomycetota bacterium]|jgi:hypothetical protein
MNKEVNIHINTIYMPDGTVMPELLTEREAIVFLRIDQENNPERTLKYYRDKGQLRAVKIGTNLLYPKQELLSFIKVATDWYNRNKNCENIS